MKKIFSTAFTAFICFVIAMLLLSGSFSVCYAGSGFKDVTDSAWYYDEITRLVERGVVNGYPDGNFRPMSKITRAEFFKLLCVALDIECDRVYDTFLGIDKNKWYARYLCAAVSNGIIVYADFPSSTINADETITRIEAAKYIFRALKLPCLPFESPYVDTSSIYATMLYSEMIMQGSINGDNLRVFNPDSGLSRSECCAVILRLILLSENRTAYRSNYASKFNNKPLVALTSPDTVEDFAVCLMHMLKNGIYSNTFLYDGVSFGSERITHIKQAYFSAFSAVYNHHPEYASLLSTKISISGNHSKTQIEVTLHPASDVNASIDELSRLNLQASSKAKSIVASIKSANQNASPKQLADAIHDYIVLNTAYDTNQSGKHKYTSYLAYGALIDGSAVCQGYASAFNLLCREAGIFSYAVSADNHMWNVAIIDGFPLIYDVTWDDPVPDIKGDVQKKYRGITSSEAPATHSIDEGLSDFGVFFK